MTLVVYPPRGRDKRIVIVHSCGIALLVVVVTTTNTALSQPTVVVVGDGPMVERFSLSFLLMAKRSERRNPDKGVRISPSANPRTTTMMRTVASLATATAIVGTASVGIGTTGVGNVMIGNNDDGGR